MATFYVKFVNAVESATANAAAQTADLDLRRRLLEGRLRATRSCRQVIFQRDPIAAFVDTWSLCMQLDIFFASDEGRRMFGEAQPLILSATHTLRTDIKGLGALFLKANQLAELEKKLDTFASEHPFSMREVVPPSRDARMNLPQLRWLLNLPLSPFHAMQGVDQTAQAVQEFTLVAGDFAQRISDMPRELAWQSELLLMQTRREITGFLRELDAKQTNAQGALQSVQLTLSNTERTLNAATELSLALDATIKTYAEIRRELSSPKAGPEKKAPGRPFDILDYALAAEEATATVTNLQELLIEFQKTVATNAITERIKEVQTTTALALTDAQKSARQLADHITKRAIQLLAFFFVALLLYRILATRLRKTSAP